MSNHITLDFLNVKIGPIISDSGIHGCVYKGTYNNLTVAIKKLYNPNDFRELEYLKQFQGHPEIISLIGMYVINIHQYIVLEFCQGDLGSIQLPVEKAQKASLQLLAAIDYLHDLNCIHGDIKPQNCLLDLCGNCRVTDFGGTLQMDNDGKLLNKRTAVFTLGYASLEVIDKAQYSPKSDAFAVGATIYFIMTDIRLNIVHGIRKKRTGSPCAYKSPFIQIPGGHQKKYYRIETKDRLKAIGTMGEIISQMIERDVISRATCKNSLETALLLGLGNTDQNPFFDCPSTIIQEHPIQKQTSNMIVSFQQSPKRSRSQALSVDSHSIDMNISYDDDYVSPSNTPKRIRSQSTEMDMVFVYDCTPSPKIVKFQPVMKNRDNEELQIQKELLQEAQREVQRLNSENEYLRNELLKARSELKQTVIVNKTTVNIPVKVSKFKCHTCGKKFSMKCNLLRHERIHGEKLLKCRQNDCGLRFTRPDIMEVHYQRKHVGKIISDSVALNSCD